jgi:hypothetical protein
MMPPNLHHAADPAIEISFSLVHETAIAEIILTGLILG